MNKTTIILDVRTPAEYQQGHAKNSVNIDFYSPSFLEEIQKLDRAVSYELYCRSGNRSGQAEVMMKQLGFLSTVNIGGLEEAGARYSFDGT